MKYLFKYGLKSYHIAYINYVEPKLAITFIDNDFYYASIISCVKNCKFFAIMNGRRHDTFFDDFDRYENLRIDNFFVFGEDFKDYVIKRIPNTTVSGSIIANHYLKENKFKKPKKIQYISLFKAAIIKIKEILN